MRVQFALSKNGSMIVYPDDIALFSNVEVDKEAGKVYAEYTGKKSLVAHVKPAPKPVPISKLSFRRRLTMEERVAIDNFEADTNLDAAEKATTHTLIKDFETAGEIALTDPDVLSGLQYLESVGLLAKGRADEILAQT